MRPPTDYSDDDDDDDDDESEEEEEEPKKKSAKLSSSEDEDDEEGDEEEEEEEERPAKKRKASGNSGGKAKKPKASSFFDEEAEASEDDEEEDDPYGSHHDPHDVVKKHYSEEDIIREQMDEAALEIMRQQDRRRAEAAGGRFGGGRYGDDEDERSVAEIAEEIENRHRMQRRVVPRQDYVDKVNDETGRPEYSPAVAQQSLVPSVSDPSLWMISCQTGKEQELVFQIMNKCSAFARQGRPLGISAVVAAQSKGKIYLESFSEPAVMEAIQGVRGLMTYSMKLVPIGDMTTVMTVQSKKKMGKYFIIFSCFPASI